MPKKSNKNEQIEFSKNVFKGADDHGGNENFVFFMAVIEFCKAQPDMKLSEFKKYLEKEMPRMAELNVL